MVTGPRALWVFLSWADESQQLSELMGGGCCVAGEGGWAPEGSQTSRLGF